MNKWILRTVSLCLCLICCMGSLCSCSGFSVSFRYGERTAAALERDTFSEGACRLVAMDYKGQFETCYSDLFGEDFWDTEIDEGMTYEKYVLEYFVFREIRAVMYLCSYAAEQGISLTDAEKDELDRRALVYFTGLSEEELDYCRITEKNVLEVFSHYALAQKAVETLLNGRNVEVSREESRVADIQVIHVAEYEEAEKLKDRLAEGESFMTLAQENTIDDKISYSVTEEELTGIIGKTVFAMTNGQISDILTLNDSCYIIRVENTHNLLLSMNQQEKLLAEKRFMCWQAVYDRLTEKKALQRSRRFWEGLRLKTEDCFPVHRLFEAF